MVRLSLMGEVHPLSSFALSSNLCLEVLYQLGGTDDDKSSSLLLEQNLICLHCEELSISGVGKTPQETQIKADF